MAVVTRGGAAAAIGSRNRFIAPIAAAGEEKSRADLLFVYRSLENGRTA
jgi:hypothetical protein